MADQEETNTETVLAGNLRVSNVVQASYSLLTVIKQAKYSINEYKVLLTYLSRINSQRPDSTVVTFSLKAFQNLAGLPNLKPSDMDKYISGLNKEIKVPPEAAALLDHNFTVKKDGFGYISLFGARFVGRNADDEWVVELKCSEDAQKLFFFDFETTQYIACLLENLIDLTHIHSMYLYFHLLQVCYRGTFTVPLNVLRDEWFCQADKETYKTFKYFKRDVLDVAVKEVNAKTDITCSYETVKKGRAVASIQFTVKRKKKQKGLNAGADSDGFEQLTLPYVDPQTPTAAMISTISGNSFSPEEASAIEEALSAKVSGDSAKMQDLFRDSYMKLLKAEEKTKQNKKKINNRAAYLIKTIENSRDAVQSPDGDGNFTSEFEEFWEEYPRKVYKLSAYDAFKKALHNEPDVTPAALVMVAREYSRQCQRQHTQEMYIKYPANFLNDGVYLELLELAEAEAAAEAQRKAEEKAREADPEYQAEQERIAAEVRQNILKTEPKPSEDPEAEAEELMAYWREIRADDIKWTEKQDEDVYAGIKTTLQSHSPEAVRAVLEEATAYAGNVPNFKLAGII